MNRYAKIATELVEIQRELLRVAVNKRTTQEGARELYREYKKQHPETKLTPADFYEMPEARNKKPEEKKPYDPSKYTQDTIDNVFEGSEKPVKAAKIDARGLNFTRLDLNDAELVNCNLFKTKFNGVTAKSINFRGSNLKSAVFDGSKFTDVSFLSAQLQNSTFAGTTLKNCDFESADVRGTDFSKAKGLKQSYFKSAIYNEDTKWPEGFTPPKSAMKVKE